MMSYLPTEKRLPTTVGMLIWMTAPCFEGTKKPGKLPGPLSLPRPRLEELDVRGARTFRALLDFVLDLVVLFQRLEAAGLDGREVDEKILAAVVGGNEPEALRVVEPLYGTCAH